MHTSSLQQDLVSRLERTEAYLASDPANPELLAIAIELNVATDDLPRAARHADHARAAHPADPLLQYRRGHVLVAQGRWREAEPLFACLLASNPNVNVNVVYSLALCQFSAGEHATALATLRAYCDDPALPPQGATLLVRAMHQLGQYDEGAALIESYADRYLDDANYCAAASLLCVDAGRFAQGALLAERALAGDARPLEALVASATLALGSADAARASERFTEALAHNPGEGRSWSGLGMASMLERDMAGAIPQLERAVRLMPGHIGSWHALGWCRLLTHDVAGAEQAFDAALALDRNFGESHGAMAAVAARRSQHALAAASIKTALRLDPSCLSARYAEMVQSGDADDPERFKVLALRLVRAHQTPDGENLAAVVQRLTAH
ncbi:tetratricopeptide repeat protein [Massilia sp. TSP1-1-2]|uniref:tetratricopeptide repeat protein n=1 Tax=Massilia sp. TSP1-1-2 TaxID=2804649 RepID=UPI003CF9D8CE